jgi:cytochrome bd ubiquinol oxidase subunit I
MLGLTDHLLLSRVQFAFTAMYHILWPVLTIGLSLYLVLMEALWLKTTQELYYRQYRFWMKVFLLNLTMGVVTGIPMEFQFGTNWSVFSRTGGDIFGHLLGFEAAMAFMLEATFLGVMAFGWHRVPPGVHLFATCMVALGASLSAFWIMVANSWMQTPAGGVFQQGRFVLQNSFESIFNADTFWAFSHMWTACLEITVFVLGGISAWYLAKGLHVEFFLRTFKIALAAGLLVTPLQIGLGDGSGREVAQTQPTKLAGIEAHWQTNRPGEGAAWNLLAWPNEEKQANDWAIQIPYGLSLITTHSFSGQVKGLREFPRDDQPPVVLPFYAFRIMLAAGFGLFFLVLWTLWVWIRGRLRQGNLQAQKKLFYAWMLALPLSYLAMEAGWVTREVGRQPWIIYGVQRTREAATPLPAEAVASSSLVFVAVYALLFAVFLLFFRRILLKGPEPRDPEREAT